MRTIIFPSTCNKEGTSTFQETSERKGINALYPSQRPPYSYVLFPSCNPQLLTESLAVSPIRTPSDQALRRIVGTCGGEASSLFIGQRTTTSKPALSVPRFCHFAVVIRYTALGPSNNVRRSAILAETAGYRLHQTMLYWGVQNAGNV